MPYRESLLFTDLSALAMLQAYADHGFGATAAPELVFRKLSAEDR
jgi:hypothetical protein